MSDIAIRFDGLLLGAVILAGAGLFAVITCVMVLRTLITKPSAERSWSVAARNTWLAVVHGAALAALIADLAKYGAPVAGPDWLDWLTLPWLGFILFGLVPVFQSGSAKPRTDA